MLNLNICGSKPQAGWDYVDFTGHSRMACFLHGIAADWKLLIDHLANWYAWSIAGISHYFDMARMLVCVTCCGLNKHQDHIFVHRARKVCHEGEDSP